MDSQHGSHARPRHVGLVLIHRLFEEAVQCQTLPQFQTEPAGSQLPGALQSHLVQQHGIVSEENLQAIRKRGGQYLVGTPRSQMKQFEEELLQDDWTQVRPEVEVKKVAIPKGEETFILCRTSGRKEKEKAIRNRFSARMEDALKRLAKTIEGGRLKDRNKMERRLGRIQASHPQVNG